MSVKKSSSSRVVKFCYKTVCLEAHFSNTEIFPVRLLGLVFQAAFQ